MGESLKTMLLSCPAAVQLNSYCELVVTSHYVFYTELGLHFKNKIGQV